MFNVGHMSLARVEYFDDDHFVRGCCVALAFLWLGLLLGCSVTVFDDSMCLS